MTDILLATINARYSHASLGLRYLKANLGVLQARSRIVEFSLGLSPEDMAERLLAHAPRIVGLGVYIWNAEASLQLARVLKALNPALILVVGGPEVSHETDEQPIATVADHVITGAADLAFAALCESLLADGEARRQAPPRIIDAGTPSTQALALPYALYDDDDIAHRNLYVEASRGCPFKCEFCLSALDRTAWPFDTDRLLEALESLHARGARRFKFVDRTFNLKVDTSRRILEFFLAKLAESPHDPVYAHFELVPDHLPASLGETIARFPPGTLQLEIGIQTWNPEVQRLVSRRQDNERAQSNLRWLRSGTHAHLHVDLIAGLPGETPASFGEGFDRLVAIAPQEIQVGILKRLRGAPIARHTQRFAMRFNPSPPYNVLATDRWSFVDMQRIARFARYWDLIGNSGRFEHTLEVLLGSAPFARFMQCSDWLWAVTDATHRLAPERLYRLVHRWLVEVGGVDESRASALLETDHAKSGGRSTLQLAFASPVSAEANAAPARQRRHLEAGPR